MKVNCKHCGRYLFKQVGTVVIEDLICPNSECKAHLNIKIIARDEQNNVRAKFTAPETGPKKVQKKATIAFHENGIIDS